MDKQDIIRMVRQIADTLGSRMCDENGETHGEELYAMSLADIEEAVKLVAAAERNRTWTQEHWTDYERSIAAAAAEQERKEFAVHAIDIARKAIEERDKFWQNHMEPQIEIEVAREREACAKLADEHGTYSGEEIAKDIRSRGSAT
jgi:hypothetical protein